MNNHPVTPANPPTAHDTQPTGRDTVHAHEDGGREQMVAVTVSVPSEEAMLDLLMGLNTSGESPELPCLWAEDIGSPGRPNVAVAAFLATLTEPDASYVNYIASDEGGRSRCLMDCDNCGSEGETDWAPPGYPVQALVAVWPDEKRCRDDDLDVWWVAARDAAVGRVAAAVAAERERIAVAIETQHLVCPAHGIPDCSPLLNGCTQPVRLHEQKDIDARIARSGS